MKPLHVLSTIVLILLIAATSFLALNKKSGSSNKEFATVLEQAQAKYDEGENLKDLNVNLAQQSFKEAKSILEPNLDKFKDFENKQIQELLAKINKEITSAGEGEKIEAKEVDKSESKLLSVEIDNEKAEFFAQNENNVYFLNGSGVTRIDKGNDEKTQIIKKTWKSTIRFVS